MKTKIVIAALVIFDAIIVLKILTHGLNFQIFNPAGTIALDERTLILTAVAIMLSVILHVIFSAIFIAIRYREDGTTKKPYKPELSQNRLIELVWWTIPTVIIVTLAVITWVSTHALDPTKTIASTNKPLTIQVVALQWRWLFIYPEQHIATVNFVEFPEKTPVTFQLTADAPMNSFWIPQLGGQMYAMSGMINKTNLIANRTGVFTGVNNEISGAGFSGMRFAAKSVTQQEFNSWVESAQQSGNPLDWSVYAGLAKPNVNHSTITYSLADQALYNEIVDQYMAPTNNQPTENSGGY